MATNWIVLTGADIRKVISARSQEDTNENTSDSTKPGDEIVLTSANRRDLCVSQAVEIVRGAIRAAGRFPYSVTTGAVPPEGERHTLVIASYSLVLSTPSLTSAFLVGDGGTTPLERRYEEAMAWVERLLRGESFTEPDDPVGEDWKTAVSSTNPEISAVKWGDQEGDQDDYKAGQTSGGGTLPIDFTTS